MNVCPQCNRDFIRTLVSSPDDKMIVCQCGFKIGKEKYKEIVGRMNNDRESGRKTCPDSEDGEHNFIESVLGGVICSCGAEEEE